MSKNFAIIESNALEAEKIYATSTSEIFAKFCSSLAYPVYKYYENLVVDTKFDLPLTNEDKVLKKQNKMKRSVVTESDKLVAYQYL